MYKIVRIFVIVSCFMSMNMHAAAYSQDELNKELHSAVWNNDYEQAERLLAAGADVNDKAIYVNETPLFPAVKKANLQIVTLLLHKGADVNIVSGVGQTPLLWGISEFDYRDKKIRSMVILAKLLKAGADPNVKRIGDSPLQIFAGCHGGVKSLHPEHIVFVILALLEAGADKNAKGRDGRRPADHARICGLGGLADLIDYWPGENLQDRILFSVLKGLCSPDEQEKEVAMRDFQYLLNTCPHYIPFFQKFGVLDIAQA